MIVNRAVVVLTALAATASAHASLVSFTSNSAGSAEGLGSFFGSITYTSATATMGSLTISVTNSNPVAGGGYITGVVFNIPGVDASATSALTAFDHPFTDIANPSAAPFGTFERGAALGGDWLGGGSPNAGIFAGTSGTFTFKITASDASSLTAQGFLDAGMVFRFKGYLNGKSDKVPTMQIPAPGSLALLGLCGGALARRRRA